MSLGVRGGVLTNTQPIWRDNVTLVPLSEVEGQPQRDSRLHGGVEWTNLSLREIESV